MEIELIENARQLGGMANHVSWTRLVEQLRAAGEIQPHEAVARLIISPRGIEYRVVDRALHPQL